LTRQRVRLGDLAAGTLLVIDSTPRESERSAMNHAVVSTGLAPEVVDLVEELLERWGALAEQERRGLARALLTRIGGEDASISGLNDGQLQQRLKLLL